MKHKKLVVYCATILSLAGLAHVHAETTAGETTQTSVKAKSGACKADSEKFCSDKKGKERMQCLLEHKSELSAECSAKLEKQKERREAFQKACGDDRATHCKDVKAGKGGLVECLKSHESELTQDCKDLVAKLPAKPK